MRPYFGYRGFFSNSELRQMAKGKPVETPHQAGVAQESVTTPFDTDNLPAQYTPNHGKMSVVEGHNGRLYPSADTPLSQCPTNLDLTTYNGKAMAMAAGNPSDIPFDTDRQCRVIATHYLIFPEERPDPDTGEISQFARTVLFQADGKIFRTTAAHAPHRIQAALDLFSKEDWAKGIEFVIRERRGKRETTYHDIRIAMKPI